MNYFIANWKSHKTLPQAQEWMSVFQDLLHKNEDIQKKLTNDEISIIICPPFHLIIPLKEMLSDYPNYSLGSQNISPYPEGSYTGEISARLIKDYVKFSLIGHSERRKYFHEKDGDIGLKNELLIHEGIMPIVCVRTDHDELPPDAAFVAFEPVESIGTGKNASVEEVLEMKKNLSLKPESMFIYGGSVDAANCREYMDSEGIDGLLIGTASLDPSVFFSIISVC